MCGFGCRFFGNGLFPARKLTFDAQIMTRNAGGDAGKQRSMTLACQTVATRKAKGGPLPVNIRDQAMLFSRINNRLTNNQGFALATLNLDHLVKMSMSEVFRQAYTKQDLVVADGNPIVWLMWLAGQKTALMPGSDLVKPLADLAAKAGVSVALVGSTDATLNRAAEVLQRDIPGLNIACRIAPEFGFDPSGASADAVIKDIETSGARLVFLALGAPKQEVFAAHARDVLPNVGLVSIGAGLDFLAGSQKRAPRLVRAFALEWAWRLLSNPRRLGLRYLYCALILPGHALTAIRLRRSPADITP